MREVQAEQRAQGSREVCGQMGQLVMAEVQLLQETEAPRAPSDRSRRILRESSNTRSPQKPWKAPAGRWLRLLWLSSRSQTPSGSLEGRRSRWRPPQSTTLPEVGQVHGIGHAATRLLRKTDATMTIAIVREVWPHPPRPCCMKGWGEDGIKHSWLLRPSGLTPPPGTLASTVMLGEKNTSRCHLGSHHLLGAQTSSQRHPVSTSHDFKCYLSFWQEPSWPETPAFGSPSLNHLSLLLPAG